MKLAPNVQDPSACFWGVASLLFVLLRRSSHARKQHLAALEAAAKTEIESHFTVVCVAHEGGAGKSQLLLLSPFAIAHKEGVAPVQLPACNKPGKTTQSRSRLRQQVTSNITPLSRSARRARIASSARTGPTVSLLRVSFHEQGPDDCLDE